MHQITFPGTLPMDEETLAVLPNRKLVIVTKPRAGTKLDYTGMSQLFESTAAMAGNDALVMTKIADIDFTALTGATAPDPAVAATAGDLTQDGRKLAVRTYTTAFEWLVGPDLDLAAAVATAPTKIPLIPTKQGEGLAYSRDQKSLLTSSEGNGAATTDNPRGGVVDRYDTLVPPPAAALPDGGVLALAAAGAVGFVLAARRKRRVS